MLVHCKSAIVFSLRISIIFDSDSTEVPPDDRIIGVLILFKLFINVKSEFLSEGIFIKGNLYCSRNSKDSESQAEADHSISRLLQY